MFPQISASLISSHNFQKKGAVFTLFYPCTVIQGPRLVHNVFEWV